MDLIEKGQVAYYAARSRGDSPHYKRHRLKTSAGALELLAETRWHTLSLSPPLFASVRLFLSHSTGICPVDQLFCRAARGGNRLCRGAELSPGVPRCQFLVWRSQCAVLLIIQVPV